MAVSDNKAFSPAYYYQDAELVAVPRLAEGQWYAPDERMRVPDGVRVDEGDLDAVMHRRLPWTGEVWVTAGKPGTGKPSARDIVFSVPKTVSLLWALGNADTQARIELAQDRAVKQAMDLFFRHVVVERFGNSKKEQIRPAVSFCALFMHGTARNVKGEGRGHPDPNLHTHAIVPDIVRSQDGQLKLLYDRKLRYWKLALSAWHFSALAYELRDAGFDIERVENDGRFRVAGVPGEATRRFSKRTAAARDFMNRGTARLRSGLTERFALSLTRGACEAKQLGELRQAWRDEAQAAGIDLSEVEAKILGKNARPRNATPQRREKTVVRAIARATEHEAVFGHQRIAQVLASQFVVDGVHDRPDIDLLDHVTEASSQLQRVTTLLRYGLPQWTTVSMLALEAEGFELALTLSQTPFASAPAITAMIEEAPGPLADEQIKAAKTACSSARLVLIHGAPGTGKTTLLKPVVAAYREAGFKVIATAEAWRVCGALGCDCGVPFAALAAILGRGELDIDDRTVVLVDEVALIGTERMVQLLRFAKERGVKLIMAGDPDQLRPIAAGSGYKLVQKAAAQATLKTTHRQVGWYRDVMAHLVEDNVAAAFTELLSQGRLAHAATPAEAVDQAVAWLNKRYDGGGGGRAVAIVKTNDEIYEISRRFRRELVAAGQLTGISHQVATVSPNGIRRTIALCVGDHVRFLRRSRIHPAIVNGTVARIAEINVLEDGDFAIRVTIPLKVQGTEKVRELRVRLSEWHDDNGNAHIVHAYVSTLFGLQGATVDRALLLLDWQGLDQRDLYVGLTRAREETTLVLRADRRRPWYSAKGMAEIPFTEQLTRRYMNAISRSPGKALASDNALLAKEPDGSTRITEKTATA
ncbi:MAG: relaxase domain-containing protein [Bosea sp.]|uniref:MobF family relaxase n=1 Tax=Bosea sp. (in: a-proteobacteria) TaxID=1871050 RepID=UPI001AD047B7|nr:MobF family relaxase [Bosea sp. (in: a-proteobacteria)]MBN9452233.1 relaxase domain-containing protein [Bosea sp. (in: a-proteobacteria)]